MSTIDIESIRNCSECSTDSTEPIGKTADLVIIKPCRAQGNTFMIEGIYQMRQKALLKKGGDMVKITKRGKKAWVTFTLEDDGFGSVEIKGSWSGWEAEPMKRKKSGDFYIVKVLPTGSTFEFGYLSKDGRWLNDETLASADSPFGSKNSVLST